MKNLLLGYLFFFSLLSLHTKAQNGCPGCLVNLPTGLAADTVYLSGASDGQVGQYYDADMSFRMPMTTTPVAATDPEVLPGLTIDEIEIVSVSNLPPGLSWEPNQTTFDPAVQTDGCGKICGTPLLPGYYEVNVIVQVQIFILSETSSFSFPIHILPGSSITEGFTAENTTGCGSVITQFINNVPSNGQSGFSYLWVFGNGNASLDENPPAQTYNQPGEYTVSYQAVIDTSDYILTQVVVEAVGCGDLLGGAPDLRVEIFNPDGSLYFVSNEVQNASTPLSYNFALPIGPGNYSMKVVDEDGGIEGGDDICGTINFTQNSNGEFINGDLRLNMTILHPVDTILSSDTIHVYEQPTTPLLSAAVVPPLCEGEEVFLSTNYANNLIWYRDSMPLLENTQSILTTESGQYWVSYTSPDGCTAVSEVFDLVFSPVPASPVFLNFDNLLALFDPGTLPDQYSLQWYWNSIPIADANIEVYCIDMDGVYTLEITDLNGGCQNEYSLEAAYNAAFPNCMPVSVEEEQIQNAWRVFPNPATDVVFLEGAFVGEVLQLQLLHISGQMLEQMNLRATGEPIAIDMSRYPAGTYLLRWQSDSGRSAAQLLEKTL
ncbi:MAG TPA: hypothetical protein PKA00_22485 [Saprospiraceae bacterium]|nr:hypothetical protein [Saprospiraceae bacterium]HMQ85696.1 hypothetical protein [Saprospiraceae bacterium]